MPERLNKYIYLEKVVTQKNGYMLVIKCPWENGGKKFGIELSQYRLISPDKAFDSFIPIVEACLPQIREIILSGKFQTIKHEPLLFATDGIVD